MAIARMTEVRPGENHVFINRKLRTVLVCLPLLLGSLAGAPMTPEQIENLLHATHQQKIAYVLEEEEGEDGLPQTITVRPD
jgi:hypothetical protein